MSYPLIRHSQRHDRRYCMRQKEWKKESWMWRGEMVEMKIQLCNMSHIFYTILHVDHLNPKTVTLFRVIISTISVSKEFSQVTFLVWRYSGENNTLQTSILSLLCLNTEISQYTASLWFMSWPSYIRHTPTAALLTWQQCYLRDNREKGWCMGPYHIITKLNMQIELVDSIFIWLTYTSSIKV